MGVLTAGSRPGETRIHPPSLPRHPLRRGIHFLFMCSRISSSYRSRLSCTINPTPAFSSLNPPSEGISFLVYAWSDFEFIRKPGVPHHQPYTRVQQFKSPFGGGPHFLFMCGRISSSYRSRLSCTINPARNFSSLNPPSKGVARQRRGMYRQAEHLSLRSERLTGFRPQAQLREQAQPTSITEPASRRRRLLSAPSKWVSVWLSCFESYGAERILHLRVFLGPVLAVVLETSPV